jgi:hypothetical protein
VDRSMWGYESVVSIARGGCTRKYFEVMPEMAL